MADLAALKNNKDALARVIRDAKAKLRALNPDHKAAFRKLEDEMRREAEAVAAKRARGEQVIPEIEYEDIIADKVPATAVAAIRRTGCAVIRTVFPRSQAEYWNEKSGPVHHRQRLLRAEGRSQPRQVFLHPEVRQAADLRHLLVEGPGADAPGLEHGGHPRLPELPLAPRQRGPQLVRPQARDHLRRPHAPAPARRCQPRPLAPHGRGLGGALDRRRLSAGLPPCLRRRGGALRSLRRRLAHAYRRKSRRPPSAACSAPIRAGRR